VTLSWDFWLFYTHSSKKFKLRIAKDQNIETLPKTLYSNGVEIQNNNVAEAFAEFFDNKVQQLVQDSDIAPNISNGKRKICCNNGFLWVKTQSWTVSRRLRSKTVKVMIGSPKE
jgi:hypothetical protein